MTNAKHAGDERNQAGESGYDDPAGVKHELFVAWMAEHPEGTRLQFEQAWVAMTNEPRPSDATGDPPADWEQDPKVLKGRMFEEWMALRPDGTREQFEVEWAAITSVRGV